MNKINDILKDKKSMSFATSVGTKMHKELQRIIIDDDVVRGNPELIEKIKSNFGFIHWFSKSAKVEAPIAGFINGKFISRRIDRMIINHDNKEIIFIDYKTDINHTEFINKYNKQMAEYANLLKQIHPDYIISGYILWLSDFTADLICCLK